MATTKVDSGIVTVTTLPTLIVPYSVGRKELLLAVPSGSVVISVNRAVSTLRGMILASSAESWVMFNASEFEGFTTSEWWGVVAAGSVDVTYLVVE